MERQPTIYCKLNESALQAALEKDNGGLDFWAITFREEKKPTVELVFNEKEIQVPLEEKSFPYNTNISELLHLISPLDLSYINELCGDDEDEKNEMLELFKSELSINLIALQKAFEENDLKQVKFYAHKLISKIVVLSIPIYDDCKYVENNTEAAETAAFKTAYQKIVMHCYIKLWQFS